MKLHFATNPLVIGLTVSLLAAEPPVVTRESAATFYRSFQRLTASPRYVAPLTALLCRMPAKETFDREQAITGPHTRVSVHLYVNAEAATAIADRAAEFPANAVIVKEKLGPNNTVADIGGMIKRAPGYDPANGDWEFFFHAADGAFASGKLANCIECHNGGKRDHVFSAWTIPSK